MRKLTLAVALALAAMAADAATVPRSSLPGAANATPSVNGSVGAPITNSVPTATTTGTGTTTGNTTTTTTTPTTTTTSPAATASNGANLNRALSATVTNSGSLGSVIPGNNTGLASTLANGASLSSPTGTATGSAVTGTDNGPFTNGGVGGIVTIDNGGGPAVNGVNANGEIVGGTFAQAQAPAQQQFILQQQSALTPELTALERRELRKRNNVAANKQLLNSVAPRTNVDRTWQMPDDPPSPALTTSPLR
jgi:hypothetical protein